MPQKALTSASNKLDHRNFLGSTRKNLAKTWAYWKWTPKTKGFLARRLHTFITWHMWDPFKMTPLQGEPAGESNTTCIGLLQHGPGEVSQTNSAWTFWGNNTPSVVKMAIGFHQKHLYLVSGVTQTPEASNRTPACGVLSSGYWELEGQQRLGPLTCFYDQIFWSVHFITHHHSVFYFRLWLATSLPKQTAELHNETIGCGASTVITSHTHAIQHNLVQVKNQATSSLTVSTWSANDPSYFFHNLPCVGWWPESESGPEKNDSQWGAESLSWCLFYDFMFQQQGHFPTKHQHGMMANWRQNDAKGLESSSCASDLKVSQQSHNIVLTKLPWMTPRCPGKHFVPKPQWVSQQFPQPTAPPGRLSATRIYESKMQKHRPIAGWVTCAVLIECQSRLRVLRLRIWVLQPNEWWKACVLADFSLQFLDPWQFTAHGIWIVVLVWQGNETKDNWKLSLSSSKVSYCHPQLALASDSMELVSAFIPLAGNFCILSKAFVCELLKAPEVGGNTITHQTVQSDKSSPILAFDSSDRWRIILNKTKIPHHNQIVAKRSTFVICRNIASTHALSLSMKVQ